VEQKTASLTWHYRAADPEFGAFQAKDLQQHLNEVLSNQPVEVLSGDHVIEVRPHGVNKGRIVEGLLPSLPAEARIVAIGDDTTDEDLFAALPEGAVSIHVGPSASRARIRVAAVADVRRLLRALLAEAPAGRA
jgi:trehalose 6-phosphate synthase/phosphatase